MARNLFATGDDRTTISDTEKMAAGAGTSNAFNITWLKVKQLMASYISSTGLTQLKIGASIVIDSNKDIVANTSFLSGDMDLLSSGGLNLKQGQLSGAVSSSTDSYVGVITGGTGISGALAGDMALIPRTNIDGKVHIMAGDAGSPVVSGTFDKNGIYTPGTVEADGGFVPFTGCHIAKSNEDLQLGELVQIKSIGWVNPKQPDWIAEYCNGSTKGVYGVVYEIQVIDIMEDYEETVITKRLLLPDKSEVVIKQRKIGEFTQYLIAAVGDGFITVDCACEYGDVLIPSETKGLATVYKGDYIPLNSVGFAGQDSEGGKIAWTKE